jgi:1-acyl-sn-glycerol-3-phosphate acyltransferase
MSPRSAPLVATPAAPPAPARLPLVRRAIKSVLQLYMLPYHHLSLVGAEHIPPRGPLMVVLNHASLLDVPALMVLDPFPDTATVVKIEMFRMPIVGWFLHQWGAIPVEREGRDSASIRRMLGVLRSGGALAVAAEGTRTRSGRLEAINPVLARLASAADVPILPVGIGGSFAAMPPGAHWPRPVRITVRVGPTFRLERGTDGEQAARRIRAEIARLLPPEMQPLD